jgi:hypothetical protein
MSAREKPSLHQDRVPSSPRHNLHDFQPVAGLQLAISEIGRGHCFPIVLDDNAAGQNLLRDEKLLK